MIPPRFTPRNLIKSAGEAMGGGLTGESQDWSPSTLPARTTMTDGQGAYGNWGRFLLQWCYCHHHADGLGIRKRLSPMFAASLMGWHPVWAIADKPLSASEMASHRRRLRSHFSALLETISADEPLGGLFDG